MARLACLALLAPAAAASSGLAAVPLLPRGEAPEASAWSSRRVAAGASELLEESLDLARQGPRQFRSSPEVRPPRKALRLLRGLFSAEEVESILALVGGAIWSSDEPPDIPVATRRVVLARNGAWSRSEALAKVVEPIVEGRLLPYMREELGSPSLVAAEVLLRCYAPEERRAYRVHFDHNALGTAVVDLTPQPGSGLFVGYNASASSHFFVPFQSAGDAAVHGWDAMHGVRLQEGHRRVSIIVWAKPLRDVEQGTTSWFADAARRGDPDACFRLGVEAEESQDLVGAQEHLERAAGSGHAHAMQHLGRLLQKTGDAGGAARWLAQAAASGFSIAQVNCGDSLREAGDVEAALEMYQLAALQGDEKALHRLSDAYMAGEGVERDREFAIQLLRESARCGKRDAQFALAQLPEVSQGESRAWLRAAASQGHARALLACALEAHQRGDEVEGIDLLRKAARAGHPWAAEKIAALQAAR